MTPEEVILLMEAYGHDQNMDKAAHVLFYRDMITKDGELTNKGRNAVRLLLSVCRPQPKKIKDIKRQRRLNKKDIVDARELETIKN